MPHSAVVENNTKLGRAGRMYVMVQCASAFAVCFDILWSCTGVALSAMLKQSGLIKAIYSKQGGWRVGRRYVGTIGETREEGGAWRGVLKC